MDPGDILIDLPECAEYHPASDLRSKAGWYPNINACLTRSIVVLLIFGLNLVGVGGMVGVDLTREYSVEDWKALKQERTVQFAIARLMNEYGVIDKTGLTTLGNAYRAGITDLSGYIYPCISSSTFGLSNNLKCPSPQEQVTSILKVMNASGLAFKNNPISSWIPTGQPSGQPSRQPTSRPSVPTGQPTRQPSRQPTGQPTGSPTTKPTKITRPTPRPTPLPTARPTAPTLTPTLPTANPTAATPSPTPTPTPIPTSAPTQNNRTAQPSSRRPSVSPTPVPTTRRPTSAPTVMPTALPTYINGTRRSNLGLKRIFLMVEDESPNRYFSVNNIVNQQYLTDLAFACWGRGIQLGIYTTMFYWSNIMTLPYDSANPSVDRFLSNIDRDNIPLWVPRFDGRPGDMSFFTPFGGWQQVYMKQFSGGSPDARRAGSWRINNNYVNTSMNSVVIDPIGPYMAAT